MANVFNYRRIPLSDTPNFRDLGGYPTTDGKMTQYGVFFRSACPNSLNADDVALLRSLNLTTSVDLRGGGNADETQRGFVVDGIEIFNFPVGGGEAPKRVEDCARGYMDIAESPAMAKVLTTLARSDGAAVFHCFAGKDRTGVVAALLLSLAGVSDVDIIADYTLTYAYFLTRIRQDFLRTDVQKDVFKPLPEHMEGFLALLRTNYGTTADYMRHLGVALCDIEKLKEKLVKRT